MANKTIVNKIVVGTPIAKVVEVGFDSADVIGIVDSAYVQARQTPQDFAYSSLTGAPTALSSFTNDTNYITSADIPATVDSDYVAARAPAGGGGLDSAAVISLTGAEEKTSSTSGLEYVVLDKLRVEGGAIGLSTLDASSEIYYYGGAIFPLAGNPSGQDTQNLTHNLWSTNTNNVNLTAANDVYVGSRYAGTKFSYPAMISYVPTSAEFGGGFKWDHAGTQALYLTKDSADFNGTVSAPEFKFSDGTSMTTAPTGGGGGSSLGLIEKQYAFDGVLSANVGDARLYLPDSCSSADIKMYLKTASVSGSVDVNYKINGSTDSSITIAQGSTSTSATLTTAVSTGDFVTFDITSAGSGAEDLYILLSYTRS